MKRLIWLLSLSILVACGGGGGGGSDDGGDTGGNNDGNDSSDATVDRVSLTGLAVKGLARNAKIEIFTLSGSNFKSTADVETATDNEGRYDILLPESLEGYEGPVKIQLSHKDGAELQCDVNPTCNNGATNFGDFYAMPADFELSSIVNIGSGLTNIEGDTIANISALTTLATEYLERDGNTISSDTLDQSTNQIRAVFSLPKTVDLSSTEPQVVTSDDVNGDEVYGAVNAAFLKLAEDTANVSLNDIIESFSDQLSENDGQVFQKAPTSDPDEPSILTISTAADAYLDDGELDDVISDANAAAAGAITDINPPSISAGNDQTVSGGATVTVPTSVIFGTATNPTYLWQVLSGPLNIVGNASATTSTLSFTAPADGGEIKLRVLVEANEGSDNDIVIVTVNPTLSGNTAASGKYLLSGMHPAFFGGSSHLAFDHEVFFDELDLTFNANGTGSLEGLATNTSEFYEGEVYMGTPDALTFGPRDVSIGTLGSEDAFSLNFEQLSSGGLLLTVPQEIEEEPTDADPNITERIILPAREIRFYELASGLYGANIHNNETSYLIGQDGIQPAEPSERRIGIEQLAFHKATGNSDITTLANKAYTGIEWLIDITDGGTPIFDNQVAKLTISFNADASQFNVTESVQKISGLPNSNHTGANTTFTMTGETVGPDPEATAGLSFSDGRLTTGLNGSATGDIFYMAFSSDLSAAAVTGFEYANDSGTEFGSSVSSYEGTSSGVYIEKPTTPQNLNNKEMAVTFQNYIIENGDTNANPIAPEIIVEHYQGKMVITDGELKLQLELRQGKVAYPDGVVDQTPSVLNTKITYDSETTYVNDAMPLVSTTQDADGCLQENGGNFELCVSDNGTVIGWSYGEEVDGTYQNLSMGRLLGKVTGDYAPTGFTNADLGGSIFDVTYPDGVAPYTFVADKTGSVTFPGDAPEAFDWFIDGEGRLIVKLAGGETDRYTLTSGNVTNGTITLEIDSGNGYVVDEGSIGATWVKQ